MGNKCSSCCSPPSPLGPNSATGTAPSSCMNCDDETSCGSCPCCLPVKKFWNKMFRRGPAFHMPTKPNPDERPKPSALPLVDLDNTSKNRRIHFTYPKHSLRIITFINLLHCIHIKVFINYLIISIFKKNYIENSTEHMHLLY